MYWTTANRQPCQLKLRGHTTYHIDYRLGIQEIGVLISHLHKIHADSLHSFNICSLGGVAV